MIFFAEPEKHFPACSKFVFDVPGAVTGVLLAAVVVSNKVRLGNVFTNWNVLYEL